MRQCRSACMDLPGCPVRGRTTFIVAHRFSTVQRADRIAVLEAGRLITMGTHEELQSVPGYYRDAILAEKGGTPDGRET